MNHLEVRKLGNGKVWTVDHNGWTYFEARFQFSDVSPIYSMVCRVPSLRTAVIHFGVDVFWQGVIDPTTHHVTQSNGPTLGHLEEIIAWIGDGTIDTRLAAYTSNFLISNIGFYIPPGLHAAPVQQLWELLTVFGAGNPNVVHYPW
ncbi:MAG: hypothetical protein Q6353_022330 [Candidatus Sigynarchaeum springense]